MKWIVAAISNHLQFDVYDLDIGSVRSNTELGKLLVWMKNRSILLVEDVDCALTTEPRRDADGDGPDGSSLASKNHKVTLSGLLNMDGLWSSSGHERILILPRTTRTGWTWRCLHGLLQLRCLQGAHGHSLFADIEALLPELEVAPAEVAERPTTVMPLLRWSRSC